MSSSEDDSVYVPVYEDTRQTSKKLREKLIAKLESTTSAFESNNRFVAEGGLDELIKKTSVMKSMRIKVPTDEEAGLVDFITTRAKKAFAIAVFAQVNTNVAMRWLRDNNIDDDNLPILKQTEFWKEDWRWDFYEHQWKFTAPVFSMSSLGYNLEESHVLPFIEKSAGSGEGSFGEVTRYVLHKDHMLPVSTTRCLRVYELSA